MHQLPPAQQAAVVEAFGLKLAQERERERERVVDWK